MKCKLLLTLLSLSVLASAQAAPSYTSFLRMSASGAPQVGTLANGGETNEKNSGTKFHQITWTKSGTIATCSVQVESSADGITWNSGDVIAAQTCTSNGATTLSSSIVVSFIRINITVLSGSGTVTVVYQGYATNAGGGGSGTVTSVGSGFGLTGGPITGTGTLSLNVPTPAQGGILWFPSTTTLGSSALEQVNQPMFGGGLAGAPFTGTKTGNTTQLATFFGTPTPTRCIDTDGAGNLQVTSADCGTGTLPSGTQGNPVVNTSGASTYATTPVWVDVSQFPGSSICAQTIAASTGSSVATVYDARAITGTSTCSPTDSNNWLQNFQSDSVLLLGNITVKLGTQFRNDNNCGSTNGGGAGPYNCVAAVVIPNRIKIVGLGPSSTSIQADPANWVSRSGTITSATVSGSGAQCTQASNHCWVHLTFSGLPNTGMAPNFGELVQLQSTTSGTADSNSGMYHVCKSGTPSQNGGCQNNPTATTVDFYNSAALATSNGGTVYFGVPIFAWGYDSISAAGFGNASYAQNELLENVGISCQNIEGCVGFLDNSAEEHSIVRSVTITKSPFAEMVFEKQGGSAFGNSGPIEDLYLLEPTTGGGSNCHYGTVLLSVGDSKAGIFDRATVTSLGCTYSGYDPGGGIIAADILLDGQLGGNTFIGYHTESAHDGFLVGANSGSFGVTIIGERGHSTTTNCIHISNNFNTASGSFFAQSTVGNSCTNTLTDDQNSNTLTGANNNSIERYATDQQGYPWTNANPADIQNGFDCYLGSCGYYLAGVQTTAEGRNGNISITGAFNAITDGTHAGILQLLGNTTAPATSANSFGIIGPPSASFTKNFWQPPAVGATAGQTVAFKAAASNINSIVYVQQDLPCADTSASATTYTCSTGLSLAAYANGQCFSFYAINQDNSGASTLNVDGIAAKSLVKWQGTALAAHDLKAAAAQKVCYDGTNLEVSTIGNAPSGGGGALSAITAATGTATIASGNNPIIWNWAQTTNTQNAFAFGETSAATSGTLTNSLANQVELNVSTASASTAAPLNVTQGSVTATTGPPAFQIQTTWNNVSLVGHLIFGNATNTSSAATSDLINLQVGNAAQFVVLKSGLGLFGAATAPTVGTAGGTVAIEGTAFTGASTNYGWYNDSTLHCFDIIDQTTNIGCGVGEASIIGANIIPKATGTTSGVSASSITDNGTTISSTETLTIGAAAGSPALTDKSIGFLATAMGAQTTATCTNVTNMTWNIAANKNYILRCEIPMTLAATATIQYCLGGPGTATSYSLIGEGDLGTAGIWSQISTLAQTAYGTKTNASAAVAANTVQHVWASIQNGATASGTALTLQTAANGTNAITVGANATCELHQVN